jgi:hypothetical protein
MKAVHLILSIILALCLCTLCAAQNKSAPRSQSKSPQLQLQPKSQPLSPLTVDATRKAITALRRALATLFRQYASTGGAKEDICAEIDLDVSIEETLAYLPATAYKLELEILLAQSDYQIAKEASKLEHQEAEEKQRAFIQRALKLYPNFKESEFLKSFPDGYGRILAYLTEIHLTAHRSAKNHLDRATSLLVEQQ